MFCPQCYAEYREGFVECSDCHVPLVSRLPEPAPPADSLADAQDQAGEDDFDVLTCEGDLDVLIRTDFVNPIAINLAKTLLREAGIPFFTMNQNLAARQKIGGIFGWWIFRVPSERATEAREILRNVEEVK
jgi:hypothetical protein